MSPFRPERQSDRILAAVLDASDDAIVGTDLEGAVFGGVKASVDRGAATGFDKTTGTWPIGRRTADHLGPSVRVSDRRRVASRHHDEQGVRMAGYPNLLD